MKYITITLGFCLIITAIGWMIHVQSIRHSEQCSLNMLSIESLSDEIKQSLNNTTQEYDEELIVIKWANSASVDFSKYLKNAISKDSAIVRYGPTRGTSRQNGPDTTYSFAIVKCRMEDRDNIIRQTENAISRLSSRDAHVVLVNDA